MVDIRITEETNLKLISVSGEIDASSSIELDNALNSASETHQNILIDLSGLDYISSAGLGVFISYLDDFKKKGVSLVMYGLQEKVSEVFAILGLQQLMNIKSTEEEARKVFE